MSGAQLSLFAEAVDQAAEVDPWDGTPWRLAKRGEAVCGATWGRRSEYRCALVAGHQVGHATRSGDAGISLGWADGEAERVTWERVEAIAGRVARHPLRLVLPVAGPFPCEPRWWGP